MNEHLRDLNGVAMRGHREDRAGSVANHTFGRAATQCI